MIQDSGNRREFETGAVRDIAEGKGRCDLLPLDIVAEILPNQFSEDPVCGDPVILLLNDYMVDGDPNRIYHILNKFMPRYFDNVYNAILEVAKHFEEGCKKYGSNNWRKGIPAHCYIDSAIRHYLKFLRGDVDERHDRAFLWNLMCLLWTVRNVPDMNDLPFAEKSE